MATCSIFDDITINNPAFLEEYLEYMENAERSCRKISSNPNIRIATPEDIERIWKIRRERREKKTEDGVLKDKRVCEPSGKE